MKEDKRTYETNAFHLPDAALVPRPARGNVPSGAPQGLASQTAGKPADERLFTRDTILRLIQTLKDK